MPLLNSQDGGVVGALSSIDQAINNSNQQDFQKDGFIVSPIPNSDGNGLPSSKVKSGRRSHVERSIIHWFVPEIGIVNMYINPQRIVYNDRKVIDPQRTKGGYVVQYWGEELTTLNISGHTGSSGIEGINVLHEIYRAEQLNFDPIALTMAADNSISGLNDLIDSALGNLGGFGQSIMNATNGLLGLDPASQNVLPRNVPSLAAMALGVEMYYSGKVHRGFFTSFVVNESADQLGLFNYDIGFTVTQIRGYRLNGMAWQRSAINGPSNNSVGGIPLSVAGLDNE